jgi:hypothetical protein
MLWTKPDLLLNVMLNHLNTLTTLLLLLLSGKQRKNFVSCQFSGLVC